MLRVCERYSLYRCVCVQRSMNKEIINNDAACN